MFRSSGHGKPSESRRMNYREEHFADADDDDDDYEGGYDTDSPFFEPTDLSDNDFCGCTRSPAVNTATTRRDRPLTKTSRRPSQVPCAVEADSLPLARPIPLHYDSDLYDTWCTKSRKLKRHSGGEKYQENRDGAAVHVGDSKFKTSPLTAPPPPPPETVARIINQSVSRQTAVGVGVAAPTATKPRFYRRLTREASRRPSRLCLSGAIRRNPEVAARHQIVHATRSQPTTCAAPVLLKLSGDARAATRHGAVSKASTQVTEVKIPVQAHVSYVPHADTPRSGAEAHANRYRPRGEICIPLDMFASPFLACSPDREHWPHPPKKVSSHRVRRGLTKGQSMRNHLTAQPVLVEAYAHLQPGDRLRKRHSMVTATKARAASDKPPQKHRAPSVRSRASETLMPHAVQSNLDALLPSYEAQLTQPSAQRRSSHATTAAPAPTVAPNPWGNRVDPRLIPLHELKPRKPESVRQREFIARLEKRLREVAQPSATNAQREAASPSASNVAQPPMPSSSATQAASTAPTAPAVHPVPSAESKLSSLLGDLMKSGFDVSHLEKYATGAAPTPKKEGAATPTPTPPKSTKNCKPDPRGYYEAVYNQQSLARVDFAADINASKASTPADLTASPAKNGGRHKEDALDAKNYREQRRPQSRTMSDCANYASQDEESVFENQDFWDTLDTNVDLNSVISMSDGFEGHEEHGDGYKYFQDEQIPTSMPRSASQTELRENLEDLTTEQRQGNHGSLHELWRHTDRLLTRAQSDKPVAESEVQPPLAGGYSKDGHEPRAASSAADPNTPSTSHGGGVAAVDADYTRRLLLTRELIVAVVEETLERREKQRQQAKSPSKMDFGQAIELIKEASSTMNDSLCLEIVKAVSDRLIACETEKSEKEYLEQLRKIRSNHLRHITRDVKRLQELELLVQRACRKLCNRD